MPNSTCDRASERASAEMGTADAARQAASRTTRSDMMGLTITTSPEGVQAYSVLGRIFSEQSARQTERMKSGVFRPDRWYRLSSQLRKVWSRYDNGPGFEDLSRSIMVVRSDWSTLRGGRLRPFAFELPLR